MYHMIVPLAYLRQTIFVIHWFQVPKVDSPKSVVESANKKIRELIDGKNK